MLFIDGVDLLAERDLDLCGALIALAKKIKMVLISSEGAVMPFLQQLSASNRAVVYEIGDLKEEKAIEYLMMMKLTHAEATRLVDYIYRWSNGVSAKFSQAQ